MNQLHALMAAELAKPTPDVTTIFEMDLPDGTVRFSRGPVSVLTLGHCEPWILDWSECAVNLSGFRGSLEAPTLTVTMADPGGRFRARFGDDLRQTVVRAKWIGRRLPAAAQHVWFKGIVDGAPKSGRDKIQIRCRMDDDLLKIPVPRTQIRDNSFPNIPGKTALQGKGFPYLVGDQDSTGLAAQGMVRGLYVGSPGAGRFQYFICSGHYPQIIRAFSAGTEKANPADYAPVLHRTRDSRLVLIGEFTADQGNNEILFDIQDNVSVPGPFARLHQLLADVAWGDFRGKQGPVTAAPLDAASVASVDVFLVGGLGYGHSYFIDENRRATGDVIREHLLSFNVQAYWGRDGKLRFVPWNLNAQNDGVFLTDRMLLDAEHYVGEPEFPDDPEGVAVQISVVSGRRASDNAHLNARSAAIERVEPLSRVRDLELNALPATAESVGNVQTLIPNGSTVISHWPNLVGGASAHAILAQGPPPGTEDQDTYVESASAATIGGGNAVLDLTLTDMPAVVAVANLTGWITAGTNGQASSADEDLLQLYWLIGGTAYPITGFPDPTAEFVKGISGPKRFMIRLNAVNLATILSWTQADLSAVGIRVVWTPSAGGGVIDGTKRVRLNQVYAQANYTAAANVQPPTLSIASRELHRWKTSPRRVRVGAPLRFLDYEPGDDVPLVNPPEGWRRVVYGQGRGRIIGFTHAPMIPAVKLLMEDVGPQLTTLWIQARALVSVDGASAAGNGMAMITSGAKVTVTRDSPDYLDDPAGIDFEQPAGPVVRIFSNCWSSDRYGTHVARLGTNFALRSSLVSGLTGFGSPTTGSGTISADETVGEQLFSDSDVTTKHLLIVAGSPHSSDTIQPWAASASIDPADNDGPFATISVDHRESGSGNSDRTCLVIRRSSDGNFYDVGAQTWGGSAVNNPLPIRNVWTRDVLAPIDLGTLSTTLTCRVVVPSGGTALREHRVGHLQIEQRTWASTRIVSDTTAATRAACAITIDNDKSDGVTLTRTIPNVRGGLRIRVHPYWNSDELYTAKFDYIFTVFRLEYDGTNVVELYWSSITGAWTYKVTAATVEYAVELPASVTPQDYDFFVRWTSSVGEWGKANKISLVVKDVALDAVLVSGEADYVAPTVVDGAKVAILCTKDNADQFDGYLIEIEETPLPPNDEEMEL